MRKILPGRRFFAGTFFLASFCLTARADDYAWGTTNGARLALIDATTATAVSDYTLLVQTQNGINQLGSSLWIANVDGTVYGVSNQGVLYAIATGATMQDVNHDTGYLAAAVARFSSLNVTGLTFDTDTGLLDLSTGQDLYSLSLTGTPHSLGSYGNQGIGGLAYADGGLIGMRYSPSPAGLVAVGQNAAVTAMPGAILHGASSTATVFYGSSGTLFVTDGNNTLSVATGDGLSLVGHVATQGNLLSLTTAESSPNTLGLDLTPVETPEPGTLFLGSLGLLAALGYGLRRAAVS